MLILIQIAIALLAIWLVGTILSVTAYGLIHVLLVLGFILFIIGIIEEKNPARWR